MRFNLIGWDIGGAHVKAAVVNEAGDIIDVFQQACPLWKGMDQLHQAVNAILSQLPSVNYLHAVTMTGELVDLFEGRDDGVRQIIKAMQALLPGSKIWIFAGKEGMLDLQSVDERHYEAIASANWLASASFAARRLESGLLVDIGSTTTDILVLHDRQVRAAGYTDYRRLISGELVYTGIVRTAIMAVARTAFDKGHEVGLMAEYFATMADVYRVTGELNESHDQTETADGAEKTVMASARRLSRMIGCDFSADELPRWQRFAGHIRAQQLQEIQRSCEKQLSRCSMAQNSPFVGAGVGRFLVRQIALNLGYPYVDFSDLFQVSAVRRGLSVADCAPAAAVARMAWELC